MVDYGSFASAERIKRRIRACNYLSAAQLFLQSDVLLSRHLTFADIKPRLLGHWGTCPGINITYANLRAYYGTDFEFVLGPGHGFPALQANLFVDGELLKVDPQAMQTAEGIKYLCREFSWPGGFPSHASPMTPGVVCEGGELGYALATAYGMALGHPEKTVCVLMGDGEFETATALSSMNLCKLLGSAANGRVLPILHLNGYKISGPTVYGRKSEREILQLVRGFGYTPFTVSGPEPEEFQEVLWRASRTSAPFIILRTEKGWSGPEEVAGKKIAGNYAAHQIPLPLAKSDRRQLEMLEEWLKSYRFWELFDTEKGFML